MNVLDLFSGIGGFSLGLERAGMRTVAFCEIDPYCRRVLARHWPDVPVYDDVRTLTAARLVADADQPRLERRSGQGLSGSRGTPIELACGIDVICGGFPCQDISQAGKAAGITGERSGLWKEYARIIGEVQPRYAIIENVSALLFRGLGDVLFDLSEIGYDAEWHCIPAAAVGAPHRRDRIWIVAYPDQLSRSSGIGDAVERSRGRHANGGSVGTDVADADSQPQERLAIAWGECGHWLVEPDVGRLAHGIPNRVDRLRALGNAVVPQIPEIIGRAIMRAAK